MNSAPKQTSKTLTLQLPGMTLDVTTCRRIHFIGVGGVGMSGLAEVLLALGYPVSGSDQSNNQATQRLQAKGATLWHTHAAEHVTQADVIVVSSAIQTDNIEWQAAQQQAIPIVARAEMLAALMAQYHGIAISGTHGKTTTTSLMTTLFSEGKLDPTFVIGGQLASIGQNANAGQGPHMIVEADESDASFLHLHPQMAVVTNIDADHMATYADDFERLQQTFVTFLHQLPPQGLAVLCHDCPIIRALLPSIDRPTVTYGFDRAVDYQALDFKQTGTQSTFLVRRPNQATLSVTLNLPGAHNALNALAAIAVATEVGIPDAAILRGLAQFAGVGRRFQQLGQLPLAKGGAAILIDDYGHHPCELEATLTAAHMAWPQQRIVMMFQPHRYSRTAQLFSAFCAVLAKVDVLLLLPTYTAGEVALENACSQALATAIAAETTAPPLQITDTSKLSDALQAVLQPGDIVLAQGAGSISAMAHQLYAQWPIAEAKSA